LITRMMMRLAFAACLAATAMWAADVTGKWTAEFQTPNGNTVHTAMDFKADGSKLTGTVQGGRGGEADISDGKIDGDDISFSVVREFNGNQLKMNYKGKVQGDTIHFTVTREGGQGRTREFDAKRAS
jgi:hypothetical protein